MIETRKIKSIDPIENDNNKIKVTWEVYREEVYSHDCEQYYANENLEQFFFDVGNELAIPYLKHFDIKL